MEEALSLDGKVVLVTGAASGLGEATARAFASAGCHLAVVDVNQQMLAEVYKELHAQGNECLALPCDITNATAIAEVVRLASEWAGHLDILVNCAAVDYTFSVEEM